MYCVQSHCLIAGMRCYISWQFVECNPNWLGYMCIRRSESVSRCTPRRPARHIKRYFSTKLSIRTYVFDSAASDRLFIFSYEADLLQLQGTI